ncbi:FAD-dependent oxidoreductase [Chitinophaga sp. GCM10012297]|uniref:NAD(P)-binding protein n=1 Tax=Chitinophaga chungangae TaxID=2821488 RepID=A0ABS3Y7Y4_9BACT|nr:NAD(P)/FAD-dependent oxidoreductase [Chitinophaga chungangae]MBO9150786.1 NAD(P)-binding protein [Chitinophaga chungangae]
MKLSRSEFLRYMALLAGGAYVAGCHEGGRYNHITGKITGASAAVGHRLREGQLPAPQQEIRTKVLIAGGGIAGLSAARALSLAGMEDFLLVELEASTGGNSASGSNDLTQYPLGAHYLPLPNPENISLLNLLEEAGILTGYENGVPAYEETSLCFEPSERLLYNGRWQEGLIPQFGIGPKDETEIRRFLALMQTYRDKKGADGKWAFDIPVANSSSDAVFTSLDCSTMAGFLRKENFTSEPLLWYINYCCRDDYGAGIEVVSAWAGIHYFASRRGRAANADSSAVLTWPEGNGRLVRHLRKFSEKQTMTGTLAYQVEQVGNEVQVHVWDHQKQQTTKIIAEHCILAIPQFIAGRLLQYETPSHFTYAPWLVANITLNRLPEEKGAPLSWDNVMYNQQCLGYITAQHQSLRQSPEKVQVISLYWPLDQLEPTASRHNALKLEHKDWVDQCMTQLEKMHPGIYRQVNNIDVQVWGHGMVRPIPGFMTAPKPTEPERISFAHSDLSGVSVFEEAFYHGERAAKRYLNSAAHS